MSHSIQKITLNQKECKCSGNDVSFNHETGEMVGHLAQHSQSCCCNTTNNDALQYQALSLAAEREKEAAIALQQAFIEKSDMLTDIYNLVDDTNTNMPRFVVATDEEIDAIFDAEPEPESEDEGEMTYGGEYILTKGLVMDEDGYLLIGAVDITGGYATVTRVAPRRQYGYTDGYYSLPASIDAEGYMPVSAVMDSDGYLIINN